MEIKKGEESVKKKIEREIRRVKERGEDETIEKK